MTQSRTEFVTRHYYQLQGLRLVPLGLILLCFAVGNALGWMDQRDVSPHIRATFLTRVGLVMWVALLLALAAPFYYRRRYGSVEPLDRSARNRWITATAVGFLFLIPIDRRLDWPVSLHVMVVGLSLVVTAWHDGNARRHYMTAGLVWLAASLLPELDVSPRGLTIATFGLGGVTLIACGIGDHLLLTRTLVTPKGKDDDAYAAAV